jgi:signal transduction histidine kinase
MAGQDTTLRDVAALKVDRVGRVEVSDDGCGGADPATGTGLHGLSDRVAALGGILTLLSVPGQGTRVVAELPCG